MAGEPNISRKVVLENGEKYVECLLKQEAAFIEEARSDWLKALEFFYSRVLLQGRSDEMSFGVISVVNKLLKDTFRELGRVATPMDLMDPLRPKLEENIGKGDDERRKVGKRRDIDLVLDSLVFLAEEVQGDWNIVNYSIRMIKSGLTDCVCRRLTDGIKGVGPKTSMLFLRDLYLHFEEELRGSMLSVRDYEYLQPVDTWVRKVAQMLGMVEHPEGEVKRGKWDWEIRSAIVREFGDKSPLFNAGAWFTGYVMLGGRRQYT